MVVVVVVVTTEHLGTTVHYFRIKCHKLGSTSRIPMAGLQQYLNNTSIKPLGLSIILSVSLVIVRLFGGSVDWSIDDITVLNS